MPGGFTHRESRQNQVIEKDGEGYGAQRTVKRKVVSTRGGFILEIKKLKKTQKKKQTKKAPAKQ